MWSHHVSDRNMPESDKWMRLNTCSILTAILYHIHKPLSDLTESEAILLNCIMFTHSSASQPWLDLLLFGSFSVLLNHAHYLLAIYRLPWPLITVSTKILRQAVPYSILGQFSIHLCAATLSLYYFNQTLLSYDFMLWEEGAVQLLKSNFFLFLRRVSWKWSGK